MKLNGHLVSFVVVVVVVSFVSLYPVLDCEEYGCPNSTHSALGAATAICVAGVLFALRSTVSRTDGEAAALRFVSDAMSSQITVSLLFRPPKD